MEIPSYLDFLKTLDMEKLVYDVGLYCSKRLKGGESPINEEQQRYIADMIFAQSTALLGQYHAWISEKLQSNTP